MIDKDELPEKRRGVKCRGCDDLEWVRRTTLWVPCSWCQKWPGDEE